MSSRRLVIARALPEGARRAASQGVWVHAVQSHPDVATLRADAHRNLMAVVWTLARHADWTTLTTRPTWAVLMERTGLGRSTVAAWLAWLRRAGLLGTVTPGTTVRYRRGTACGLLDDGRGNEAAEYVLAVPAVTSRADACPAQSPVEETRTPSCPPQGDKSPALRGRAREATKINDTDPDWPLSATPATKRDMIQACRTARRADLTLRRVSDRHLRSLLRAVFACGATLGDAIHMINHLPDGKPWTLAGTPRYLPGWIRHRLSVWLDEHGRLRPGVRLPSHERSAAAQAQLAAQQARRERHTRALAAAALVDVHHHASQARAMLAARGIGQRYLPDKPRSVSAPSTDLYDVKSDAWGRSTRVG
ncbi:hypothetical protein [Sphaerisporangium rhizosphaerae]|uniref:Helix-turn-helix domain-containing protein n=1 Tax=Sphaerisporangium rhizosphaerae TaxID=2269375 RepID=A0ABW2PDZ7_9ACTN